MSNRAQRRAAKKLKKPAYRGLTPEQKREQLFRNGITADDLDKSYRQGVEDGYKAAVQTPVRILYAAMALTCRRQLHFGRKRIRRFMTEADEIVRDQLSTAEALEQVWQETGLALDFRTAEDGTIIRDA